MNTVSILNQRNIIVKESITMWENIPIELLELKASLESELWQFYCVDGIRGYCYYNSLVITIPLWATKKGTDYLSWYIAHEMSHAIAGSRAKHGAEFMATLMRICPVHCRHFELTYKPMNARRAGIKESDSILDSEL